MEAALANGKWILWNRKASPAKAAYRLTFWKCKTIGTESRWLGAGPGVRAAKGYEGAFCMHGAVLYHDRGGDYETVCFCQNLEHEDGEGNGYSLQDSCLESPINGGAWWAAVHWVSGSQTWPSDFTFTFHFHALEKEMAPHCSVLAWRIPGTGEPSGLPSMGSHRAGHDWSDLAEAAAAEH